MTIGIIATIKVQPGKGEAFEAVFGPLRDAVKANEPGVILYQYFKDREDPDTYIVMEIYKDQASLDLHGKTPHFVAAGPKLGGVLAGRPTLKFLDGR